MNSNSNEICHRCRSKEATYTCLMCESFKNLCNQCDLYVHGLPSKKKHKRAICNYGNQRIQSEFVNLNNQNSQPYQNEKTNFISYNKIDRKEKSEEYNSSNKNFPSKMIQAPNEKAVDWDSKFNFSSTLTGTNDFMKTTQKDNFGQENKNINIVDNSFNYLSPLEQKENLNSNFNTLPNKLSVTEDSLVRENYVNSYIQNPYSNQNLNNPLLIEQPKPANFNTFSREYMTELKNIFEKEKNELIYKNNTLQTNLDRLKINFTEQINNLNSDITDQQKRNSISLNSLQESYEIKIKNILDEKDSQINLLMSKIEELDCMNNELNARLENNLRDIHGIREDNSEILKDLNIKLINRDEEIRSLRQDYERRIDNLLKNSEEKNNKIVYDYETKIQRMIDQFEEGRNRMTNMLQDRENDLKNMIEKHRMEIESYEKENTELRKEIECHKQNILAIRNKRNNFEDEISGLNEFLEKMKQETKFQMSEIKILDSQNKKLMKENEELKIQVSKLDKLVYGKIRTPNFK